MANGQTATCEVSSFGPLALCYLAMSPSPAAAQFSFSTPPLKALGSGFLAGSVGARGMFQSIVS